MPLSVAIRLVELPDQMINNISRDLALKRQVAMVQHQSAATAPPSSDPRKPRSYEPLERTTLADHSAGSSHRGARPPVPHPCQKEASEGCAEGHSGDMHVMLDLDRR
jgi:hypothetical protein